MRRYEGVHSVRVRNAEPRDIPAIADRHAEQNRRDGTNYPMARIFNEQGQLLPNIALALVVEDDDGAVLQGIVFESIPEMQIYGTNPRATAFLERNIEGAWYLLAGKGFQVVNCEVPKQVAKPISKPLKRAGFTRSKGLINFFRELSR
jgi:hypothetical protein